MSNWGRFCFARKTEPSLIARKTEPSLIAQNYEKASLLSFFAADNGQLPE